ncbi:hypothetical protein PBY51_007647 [Eleginops maclovinus]|uniref:Uncharacterized protein n=1 Tax=Eleginops maclovinus TaxID=56733 RepID=A0AAN7X1T7_ELEMC|nr:hypothetical protein PBY51_007647 [Eleginops maclovinus]
MGQPVGGATEGKTAGCPQGYEGQGPFEVGRVPTLCDPPRTPPFYCTSHMDTSENYPWEHCGSRSPAV